jgi:hypothetical protein
VRLRIAVREPLGTAGALATRMPLVPVVIASLALGIFLATLRLGRPSPR